MLLLHAISTTFALIKLIALHPFIYCVLAHTVDIHFLRIVWSVILFSGCAIHGAHCINIIRVVYIKLIVFYIRRDILAYLIIHVLRMFH